MPYYTSNKPSMLLKLMQPHKYLVVSKFLEQLLLYDIMVQLLGTYMHENKQNN